MESYQFSFKIVETISATISKNDPFLSLIILIEKT